jgi:hypothetical protein
VDGVLCCLQGCPIPSAVNADGSGRDTHKPGPGSTETEENETRTEGRGIAMAKVIEFYIPSNFQKRMPSIPPKDRGKVIEFCATKTKTKTA